MDAAVDSQPHSLLNTLAANDATIQQCGSGHGLMTGVGVAGWEAPEH